MKKIILFLSIMLTLVSCDSNTPTSQQDLVDKVTAEIKKSMDKPDVFRLTECYIDTIASNSPFIDLDAEPDLYGAALYMKIVKMSSDLEEKTGAEEDLDQLSASLDSVRTYMTKVMPRVAELKKQESKTVGYFVAMVYNDGKEDKEELWYYDIEKGVAEKKDWEIQTYNQMRSLLDEFTENPKLLDPNYKGDD